MGGSNPLAVAEAVRKGAALVQVVVYTSRMSAAINVHEAKTHFSKLLDRVAMGEEVVIAKSGEPVAKLVPIAPKRVRTPGGGEGVIIPDSFFEPLPEEVIQHFE